jgi:hypothetical protein
VRRAAHVDETQPAIVAALLNVGCTVQSLAAVGLGAPDLLVGYAGVNILLECKNPETKNGRVNEAKSRGGLDRDQHTWHQAWRGQAAVVWSPEEAVEAVRRVLAREKPPVAESAA